MNCARLVRLSTATCRPAAASIPRAKVTQSALPLPTSAGARAPLSLSSPARQASARKAISGPNLKLCVR